MNKQQLSLEQLTMLIMEQAKVKGFGTTADDINVAEKFALIHSEVSEAFEAYRHNNIDGKDGLKEELSDIIQRTLHLAGCLDIDIEAAILKKLDANKDRHWNWDNLNENHSSAA